MDRTADAFKTISEVAEDLDLPQHVLRFWETRFTQIKPLKRGGGRRYYRPEDVELLRAIRHLLYGEGYTIRGVQRILKEQGVKAVITLVREGMGGGAGPMARATMAGGGMAEGELSVGDAFDADGAPRIALDEYDEPRMATVHHSDEPLAGLSGKDIALLQAALAELAECSRILTAARA